MKVYCAWHKQYFGEELFMGEKEPLDNPLISHGICKDCLRITEEGHEPPRYRVGDKVSLRFPPFTKGTIYGFPREFNHRWSWRVKWSDGYMQNFGEDDLVSEK